MKRISLLALSLIILLQGCGHREDPTPQNYQLKLDPATLVLSAAGEAQTVQVTTDAPSWKAEASADWIKVSTSGNTISVSAEANPDKDSRSGAVRVTAGETRAEVSVLQGGKSNRPADDPYPMASYGLDDESIFVKKEYSEGIIAANPEQNTFTVPSSAVGAQKPETGQKLIMNTPTELFPDGLLAEVQSVKETNGNYEITYRPLKLEEAFTDLTIEETDLDIGGALLKVLDADGNEVPFTKTKGTEEKSFNISIPEASWPVDIIEGLEIKPIMDVKLSMLFQAIIADATLYTFNARVKADMDIGATIALGAEGKLIDKRWPIFSMYFAAIAVGPILVTPFVQLEAVFSVSGKVSIEATAIYHTVQKQGIHYDASGGWGMIDYTKENQNGEWKELSVSPKLEGSIAYGLGLGPYFGVYGKVVAAGVTMDIKLKETVSEAFNLLDGDPTRYLNWDFVKHLQNIEYEAATVASASMNVELVNMPAASLETPEFTISSNKMKLLPSVNDKTFTFERLDDGMELTIDVFNKHLFGGRVYAMVKENAQTPDTEARRVYFDNAEDVGMDDLNEGTAESVKLKAFIPLDEEDSDIQYADIMYKTPDFETPFCLASLEQAFDDTEARAALLKILENIYGAREGSWEGCNWFNTNQQVYAMKNIRTSFKNGEFRYKITIPSQWKMGKALGVGNYSGTAARFGSWELVFEDGSDANLETFTVSDAHFTGVSLNGDKVTRFSVNSPIWSRFDDIPSTVTWLDLSKTPVEELESAKISESITGLILEDCPKLKKLTVGPSDGNVTAIDYSVKGSSGLETICLQNMTFPSAFFYLNERGNETAELSFRSCKLEDNSFPGNFTSINFDHCTFATITVSGNKTLERIDLSTSKGTGLVVKDCPKMSALVCPDTGISTFEVENLPEMVYINVENNENLKRLVPEVFDEIPERGGSVDYDIRYSYTDVGGTIEYEDSGYGFWYEGEPECGYHGKEPPEAPNYDTNPNDTKAQANFRKILKDLYECRDGSWDGCNWGDVSVPIKDMVNVKWYSGSTGGNPYEDIEITIPAEWALLPDVIVYRHFGMEGVNKGYGTIGHSDYWFLRIEGERKFKSFQINDTRLAQIFVRGEADLFAMHSPYFSFDFSNGVVRKDYLEIPAKIKTLNLTGCDYTRIFYETDAEHMPEKIILDLPYFSWEGSQFVFECTDSTPCKVPTIEVKNTVGDDTPYYVIYLTNFILPDGDVNFIKGPAYTGDDGFDTRIEAENCRADNLMVPDIGYVSLKGTFGTVRASGLEHLNSLWVRTAENVIVESCNNLVNLQLYSNEAVTTGNSVDIRDCSNLKTICGYKSGYKDLRIQNAPSVKQLEWYSSSLTRIDIDDIPTNAEVNIKDNKSLTAQMPAWLDNFVKAGERPGYDVRFEYTYGDGPYTTEKGTKFNYTDNGYGFYYAGEPAQGYHRDPR